MIETQPPVLFRDRRTNQTKIGSLLNQIARELPVFLFQLVDARHNFGINELARRLGDHAMLFIKVFGSEDFIWGALFDQKTSALDDFLLFDCG